MNEPHDPNRTVDVPPAPSDALDAGLAAGFGRPAVPPQSSVGNLRPVLLKEMEGDSAHVVKPKSDAMPSPEQTGDRYQLQGEIARGGMGAVLRGRDMDLGRDLAVKVLLEKYVDRPEVARRFLEEAQIGGQLQHPGVVPVYDIGRFGDRPYFTMKLVKGQTLAHLLAERADYTQDRPRLLAIALQVAQTLAYAHAKGVIHRDLKPANVMVGAFGEVQVMDWGLAKVLAEGGVADEEKASRAHQVPEDVSSIRTARSIGSAGSYGTDTEAGALLGTPAYMPPEQANGDVALLDRRADVFGLGAILCEILTGMPPYLGRSGEEVRRKAANGDLADATARLDGCGADRELIDLTKQCLTAEAIDRPKDAQEVADRLSAYLNGVQERLQAAQRERAVAVAREAEQRMRRKVQLALAAAVVGLLLGGGAFAWWRNEQAQAGRERDARNAEAVAALLDQCEEALRADDAAKAQVTLEAARKRSAEGGAEKETERLRRLDADFALLRDLDAIDQFRWTWSGNRFPAPSVVATRTREALTRFEADPEAVSVEEAAARVSTSVVRERIVTALDRLLRQQKATEVRALLRRVDADPYRDAVRDVVLADDREKLVELAGNDEALEQPAGFVAFLGEVGVISVERRRQLLQAAVSQRPGNLDLLMILSSNSSFSRTDGVDERLRWCQAAAAAAPDNFAARMNLGATLCNDKHDYDGAIACFRKAIAIDPKSAQAHFNLGNALDAKGQVDEAIDSWKMTVALDPNYVHAHFNLGNALNARGRVDEATACWRKAAALDPNDPRVQNNLGLMLNAGGQVDEAIVCYQKAIALDPKLAQAHYNLGNALKAKGQVDEASACFRKAAALDSKDARDPYNLGNTLAAKGQVDEASACYRKAIAIDPKFAKAHFGLGVILCDVKRDYDGAIACFRTVIALDPENARAHHNLANALAGKGAVDEAIACDRQAIALDPNFAMAHNSLGSALHGKGQVDDAIACFRQAIALDSKLALAHGNLGVALSSKGQVDDAIACWRQAIALDPQLVFAHYYLGAALADKGEVDEAVACWRKVVELDPKSAAARARLAQAERLAAARDTLPAFQKGSYTPASNGERLDLAEWCRVKKLHHAAAGLYAAAVAADPKLADDPRAGHCYKAAGHAALAAAGQGEDAAQLDAKERTRLRQQALDWLSADLAGFTKMCDSGPPAARSFVQRAMNHWQQDTDLASLRDAAALAKLPKDEQKAFTQLWTDVAALRNRAEKMAN